MRRSGRPFAATLIACGLLGAGAFLAVDQFREPLRLAVTTTSQPVTTEAQPAAEMRVRFTMCGRERHTCVVDGDTIWLNGQNLRLQSFDTPEPYDDICGGQREVALANRASARLLQLLNESPITVETYGVDGTGSRTLATVRIAGRDVGDTLIDEGLARRWPDGREFWCD